jgi:hypothetical protein
MFVISTKNSSGIIPLAGGASFTGIGEDVSAYSSIKITLRGTSIASGTLFIGFSDNNVDWDETSVIVSDPATQLPSTVAVTNIYFRLRYVNDATPHASFRIQSLLSNEGGTVIIGGGGGSSVEQVRQVVTLTASNISTKSFTLSNAPLNPAALDFHPYGGIKQHYGVDFTVSGTTLSWSGLGLDGFLAENDVIAVTYFV